MKQLLLLIGIAVVFTGCGKENKKELEFDENGDVVTNTNWKTDPDDFKWMQRRCYSIFKGNKSDPRVPVPEECTKFKAFYEQKTGKPLL
ncbi:MAG: hypothetical protein N4Q32_00020 [Neisseriaceae bacterium]|nr:hypothetical protein [Neisseriaceae bacterium]